MIGGVAQPKIQMTDSRAAAAAIHVAVTTSQNSLNSTNNSSLRTSNSNVSKSKQSLENLSHLRNTPQFQQHHVNSSLDSLNSSSLPTERNSDSSNNTYSRRRTFTSDTFLSVVSKTSDTGGGSGNSSPRRVEGLQSKRRTIQENFDKLNRTLERRLQIAENNLSQSEDNLKEVDRAQKSGVIHLMNLRIPIDLTEDPAAAAISNAQKININLPDLKKADDETPLSPTSSENMLHERGNKGKSKSITELDVKEGRAKSMERLLAKKNTSEKFLLTRINSSQNVYIPPPKKDKSRGSITRLSNPEFFTSAFKNRIEPIYKDKPSTDNLNISRGNGSGSRLLGASEKSRSKDKLSSSEKLTSTESLQRSGDNVFDRLANPSSFTGIAKNPREEKLVFDGNTPGFKAMDETKKQKLRKIEKPRIDFFNTFSSSLLTSPTLEKAPILPPLSPISPKQ